MKVTLNNVKTKVMALIAISILKRPFVHFWTKAWHLENC